MKTLAAVTLALACTAAAVAAPPPGHPSPGHAADLLGMPPLQSGIDVATLPHKATVVRTIDSNQYTYIEVSEDGRPAWLAAPRQKLPVGGTIRYDEGVVMTNFHSKVLQRTFDRILFVNDVVLTPE